MARQTLLLDGEWAFAYVLDMPASEPRRDPPADSLWQPIHVPAPWASQIDDLRASSGTGWYRRQVEVPSSWETGSILLRFGAVNYFCRIWWGERLVAEHEGGYLPFEVDISPYVRPGQVEDLTVQVVMPSNDPILYPDFAFAEIPHGKQSWYGPLGGIWQSVVLERRPVDNLTHIAVTARPVDCASRDEWTVEVSLSCSRPPQLGDYFVVRLLDPDSNVCTEVKSPDPTIRLTVSRPRLWDLDTPNLYTAQATWHPASAVNSIDIITDSFGFRTFEAKDGYLHLNGRPIYLRGALDQDYYPDLIATPPSQQFIEEQFQQAKQMGLNCMRIHIKAPDPRYYAAADKVGILIWAELPNWHRLTERAKERARCTLAGIVNRDGNHPSIVIWTIINEDWGTELVTNPEHRAWLVEMVKWLKALDPTRLVVDNSPCFPNFHVRSDVDDFHFYATMPDSAARWEAWMDDMANRGAFLYSADIQNERQRQAPLIVSEFGNWGLPDLDRLRNHYGGDPWWFDTGWDWSDGDVHPQGVEDRFWAMRLDKTFGNFAELARVSQDAQIIALKHEIESIRRRGPIGGYAITEWTDTHWECNGLLDMVRRPKRIVAALADFNGDTVIIPHAHRRAFWAGETMVVDLAISHFGPKNLEDAHLMWRLIGADHAPVQGVMDSVRVDQANVATLPSISLTLPRVDRPVHSRLALSLVGKDGHVICKNEMVVGIFPQLKIGGQLACENADLSEELSQMGYDVVDARTGISPLVMTRLDDTARRRVEQGGRGLLLAAQPDAIRTQLPRFGIDLRLREHTPWNGNWASSLTWFRKERFATQLPSDRWLDFTCSAVIPETVIADVRTPEWEENVLAGLFVGWLRRPAALVLRFPLGQGELLVSTLRMAGQLLQDPVAAYFFQEHLRQLDWTESPTV